MWKHRERAPRDDRGRHWSDAARSQGMPRTDGPQQKLGRGKGGVNLESQRAHVPADTLIWDF